MKTIRGNLIAALALIAFMVLMFFFYDGSLDQVLGVLIGLVLAAVGRRLFDALKLAAEDKRKIADLDYAEIYDEKYQRTVSSKNPQTFWYEPLSIKGGESIEVEDEAVERFELHPFVIANFAAILEAHKGSKLANPRMIRLDDCTLSENGLCLTTSRTAFYNDLVTNRAMDYQINDSTSIREMFECGPELKPLSASSLSNHIGINALVFVDGQLVMPVRDQTATISKGLATSSLAYGLTESDIKELHPDTASPLLTVEDIQQDAVLLALGKRWPSFFPNRNSANKKLDLSEVKELVQMGSISARLLGFGRLLYSGGKPQFYYAVFINRQNDVSHTLQAKTAALAHEGQIDADKHQLLVRDLQIAGDNKFNLDLTLSDGSKRRQRAERSFFANLWHLESLATDEQMATVLPEWARNLTRDESFSKN